MAAGTPEPLADRLVVSDLATAQGLFFTASGDLGRLVGRPLTDLADAVAGVLG